MNKGLICQHIFDTNKFQLATSLAACFLTASNFQITISLRSFVRSFARTTRSPPPRQGKDEHKCRRHSVLFPHNDSGMWSTDGEKLDTLQTPRRDRGALLCPHTCVTANAGYAALGRCGRTKRREGFRPELAPLPPPPLFHYYLICASPTRSCLPVLVALFPPLHFIVASQKK